MTALKIITWEDPRLKIKSKNIDNWTPELEKLVNDLFETALENDGVGLAAPQVGININIAVVDMSCGKNEESKIVLINPQIIDQQGIKADYEGCLSIPGIHEILKRPNHILVKNRKPDGSWVEFSADGQLARAICHETDHLNGLLFVDYFGPVKRQLLQRRYNKQNSRKTKQ